MKKLEGKHCLIRHRRRYWKRHSTCIRKKGATLGICDINLETLKETHFLIEKMGSVSMYRDFDVIDISAIENFVNENGDTFGKIDVMVNVVGVMPDTRLEILTEDIGDNVINVNLKTPIFFTKYVVSWMKRSEGGGSINHPASVAGHNGFPDVAIYGATK